MHEAARDFLWTFSENCTQIATFAFTENNKILLRLWGKQGYVSTAERSKSSKGKAVGILKAFSEDIAQCSYYKSLSKNSE